MDARLLGTIRVYGKRRIIEFDSRTSGREQVFVEGWGSLGCQDGFLAIVLFPQPPPPRSHTARRNRRNEVGIMRRQREASVMRSCVRLLAESRTEIVGQSSHSCNQRGGCSVHSRSINPPIQPLSEHVGGTAACAREKGSNSDAVVAPKTILYNSSRIASACPSVHRVSWCYGIHPRLVSFRRRICCCW
jgi:hypothetical protein